MYELYLQQRRLVPVLREIKRREWRTKRWVTKKGMERDGSPFNKINLHGLLRNVTYTGKVSGLRWPLQLEATSIGQPNRSAGSGGGTLREGRSVRRVELSTEATRGSKEHGILNHR